MAASFRALIPPRKKASGVGVIQQTATAITMGQNSKSRIGHKPRGAASPRAICPSADWSTKLITNAPKAANATTVKLDPPDASPTPAPAPAPSPGMPASCSAAPAPTHAAHTPSRAMRASASRATCRPSGAFWAFGTMRQCPRPTRRRWRLFHLQYSAPAVRPIRPWS